MGSSFTASWNAINGAISHEWEIWEVTSTSPFIANRKLFGTTNTPTLVVSANDVSQRIYTGSENYYIRVRTLLPLDAPVVFNGETLRNVLTDWTPNVNFQIV